MASPSRFVLVETTCPARPTGFAERLAEAAVAERLAACANVISDVRSVYWWKGRLERARECVVSFKTSRASAAALVRWIHAEHPYDVPYVAIVPLDVRNPAYARWLASEATGPKRTRPARRPRSSHR